MRLRTIVGAALIAAVLATTQAGAAETRYLSNVELVAEAHMYTATLGDLPIGTQPSNMHGETDPLPNLYHGEVTITRPLEDWYGQGEFKQCVGNGDEPGETCTDWTFWWTGHTHHVMLPVIR